jgi:hypothetical protein
MSYDEITVWLVEIRGIYSHGITGVYASEADARAGAETRASTEDGYHSFALMRAKMGEEPEDVAEYVGKQSRNTEYGTYSWREWSEL